MAKIVTVTLNPSLDRIMITRNLNLGYQNHVTETSRFYANGRGVSVSRALANLETPSHAVIALGDDPTAYVYEQLLEDEQFSTTLTHHIGPTRSDTIIVDKEHHTETHIVDDDSVGPGHAVPALIESVIEHCESESVIVCAGKLPPDTPADSYAKLVRAGHEANHEMVVMTSGTALQEALEVGPDIVVALQQEAEAFFNYPVRTVAQIKSSAQKLQEYECKQVLIVMNDYARALLIDEDNIWLAEADIVVNGKHSRLIDALLAGYLASSTQGQSAQQALKLGLAALAYATEQTAHQGGSLEEIEAYLPQISIHHLQNEDQAESLR